MRNRIEVLSPSQVAQLVEDALDILAKVGVLVENAAALSLLREAGATLDAAGRVHLREDLVRRCVSSAPNAVALAGRDGHPELRLGGDAVCFDPGSAALHLLDHRTRRRRKPTTEDCAHFAWVTEACGHIHAQSTALIPADVPAPIADRFRLYVALLNSRKPVVTGTFRKDGFAVMRDLLVAVRGSESALRARPLAIFDCAPTPPLKWSDLTAQALVDCARSGIPAELVSMPMAGATAPVTLGEVVLQHCAENLSGIVINQLAAPGAPIIYGGSPSAMDMRHGTTPMGAIETMMIDAANALVGKHLGLPTHAYMALSDAKVVDWQAGCESGVGAVLAALAGVNMVSGPGMLDFESCQSFEKLVLDNEACGMALRLVRGIGERDAQPGALIRAVVDTGHFLAHPHTRKHHRFEIFAPGPSISRSSYGEWERSGARSAAATAAREVERIISTGNPAPIEDDDLLRHLRELIDRASRGQEVSGTLPHP